MCAAYARSVAIAKFLVLVCSSFVYLLLKTYKNKIVLLAVGVD